MSRKLPFETFLDCVRHVPLIAIDLLIEDDAGRILLGRRKIPPAADSWFVPGGRIYKGETLAAAFARISEDELGVAHTFENATFVGVHEHFYDDNAGGDDAFGTHYLVLVYRLGGAVDTSVLPDGQHDDYRWWERADLVAEPSVHEHTRRYFRD